MDTQSIGALAGLAIAILFTWRLLRSTSAAQRRQPKRQATTPSSSGVVSTHSNANLTFSGDLSSEDSRAQNPTLGQIVRQKLSEGRKVTCRLLGVVLEETSPEELQKQATVRSSVLEVLLEITKFCDLYLMERVLDVESENNDWKMVPGLKTGQLRKKTLTQPEIDSPAAISLGSPVAPSPVLPVRSNVGPSHHVTSQPMVDSDETQAPSETQPSGVGTSKPLRVRGPTLGKGIQKIIRAKKGEKCYVHIDRGLNAMTGKYATPATNELGIQIRTLCPLKDVKSWLDLDETTKAAVIQGVLDKFQIGDDFHNDLQAQEIVNKKAYGLYKDWRYTLKQEFELLKGLPRDEIYGHPPVGVSLDNWKHLIDVVWQDASHQKRSKASKSNRSQLPYNHTNGSRSFPIAMAAMVAKDGELDFPKFYEDSHTSKKMNDWIHPKCRELHQEMVNVQAAAIESGTPLTQEEISRQVLGQKKRYLLGFGSGPQPSTIFATRAHDKDMEAMRAEVEALREERQKDHDELMKEREERERCYNELLKERDERIQLSNEMLKEREEGQKAREETNTKVEHLNNVVAKLSQLLGI
ncbi:unnamed protein product [Camellia sinensis]